MQELTMLPESATAAIESRFMKLWIHGGHQSIGSEFRTTSYITSCAPGSPFTLNGEVDERGHEVLRNLQTSNTIPDLLVHIAGDGTAISAGLARARRARFSDGVAINGRRGRQRDRGTQLEEWIAFGGADPTANSVDSVFRRIIAQTIAE